MGIEEAILQEVREKSEKRGEKKGIIQGETQTKIKGIQKALAENIPLSQIAIIFEVSLEFVKQVHSGEVK